MAKARLKTKTKQSKNYTGSSNLSKDSTHVRLWGPLVDQFHDRKAARKRPLTKVTKFVDGIPVEIFETKGALKRKIKTPTEIAEEEKRVAEALKNKRRVIFIRKKTDASVNKKK